MRDSPARSRPAPDAAALQEAALAHLARFAATEAGLLRALTRRVDRWARAAGKDGAEPEAVAEAARAAKQAAREVVRRLAAAGAVSDAAYAESRARSLARAGRSRRAIGARLAAKGVPAGIVAAVLPEDPTAELAAALAYARRRRFGPFAEAGAPDRMRQLAAFARAGFTRAIAARALGMGRAEAEELLHGDKQR